MARWQAKAMMSGLSRVDLKPTIIEDGEQDMDDEAFSRRIAEDGPSMLTYGSMKMMMGILLGLRYAYDYGCPDWVKDLATPGEIEREVS